MKINLVTFILALLVLSLLAINLVESQKIHDLESKSGSNVQRMQKDSLSMLSLKNLILLHGRCIDIPLSGNMLISDSDNRYVPLESIVAKGKFIYHLNETNCLTCVEKFLPFLKKISILAGKNNLLILGSYENPRNLFLTLQNYDLGGIPVYNLQPSYLKDARINDMNVPYIFELKQGLKVDRVFIPEKGLPDLSDQYIHQLSLPNCTSQSSHS
jgi:hypothetical protein